MLHISFWTVNHDFKYDLLHDVWLCRMPLLLCIYSCILYPSSNLQLRQQCIHVVASAVLEFYLASYTMKHRAQRSLVGEIIATISEAQLRMYDKINSPEVALDFIADQKLHWWSAHCILRHPAYSPTIAKVCKVKGNKIAIITLRLGDEAIYSTIMLSI